jgi:glycosyltransferase 2 family protein
VNRSLKVALQVAVSGGLLAVLLWQIDVEQTVDLILESSPGYLAVALVIFLVTTLGMAWRWQLLLDSKRLHEPFSWLARLYFVSIAAGQVLPTSVGGDALRIIEHARRRPNARGEVAGAVFMERTVGSAATLVLVAVGLAVAVGRYDNVAPLVWLEVGLVGAMLLLAVLLFHRRTARALQERVFPLGRRARLDRPLASLHGAMHGYRQHLGALAAAFGVTLALQAARVGAIWCCGEAVGIDVSPLVYVILGPLLFLVTMVPFTINGLGLREAFFVAFLGRFDVSTDAAFAAGFLFFAVTVATALPGALILLWRAARPLRPRPSDLGSAELP